MPGPNPQIRIGVEMDPQSRDKISQFVEDLKRRIKDLEKTRGTDDPELKRLREIQETVKRTASSQDVSVRSARNFTSELRTAASTMERMAQNLNILGGPGGAAAGGIMSAGFGLIGGLGIGAVVTAVAGVVGMAMRMGLEFERTSTRAAQNLNIGVNSFGRGYDAIRSASFDAGEPYGIGAHEMSQAIGAYGLARGATAQQAANAAPALARYSRGYGIDPTMLSGMIGTITATTQESAQRALSNVFGAAEEAGPMGRRTAEFIGTATNVLSALQVAHPDEKFGTEDAASLVRNIARLGGIYGSSQGVQMTLAAGQGLSSGMGSNLQKEAFAVRAGITNPLDLILENNDPSIMRRLVAEAVRESGGKHSGSLFAANLVGLEGGNTQAARALYYALNSKNAPHNVLDIFNSKTAGAAPIDKRVAEYLSTPLASFDKFSSKLENTVTKWGDNLDNLAKGPLNMVVKGLNSITGSSLNLATAADKVHSALDPVVITLNRLTTSFTGMSPYTQYGIDQLRGGHFDGKGGISDVGPYGIMSEIRTPFSGPMKGITNDLVAELGELTGFGYKLGIYDLNDAAHAGKSADDPHLRGRAMDIDSINGEMIGNTATPLLKQFALDVLRSNPRARIGAFPALYAYLQGQMGFNQNQIFPDNPNHVHVDVMPGGNELTGPQGMNTFTTTKDIGDLRVHITATRIPPKRIHAAAAPHGTTRERGTHR